MQRVERGQLWVMWIHALATGALILIAGSVGEAVLQDNSDLPAGIVVGPLLLLLAYPMVLAPPRRWRALGYRVDSEELRIAAGLLVRTETVVPLKRVQHIDVSQGPLERMFGVTRLVLHTAGTMNSLVVLPGLARETAEAIRDEIRARIRQDAA
jgi:membrane protein YdbS with pleckstrin-like domain